MFVKRLFVSNGLYNEIVNTLIDDIDKDKVNSFVSELCNPLIDSAKTTFGTHKYKTRPDTRNKKPKGDKPWFNYECKVARQNYRKLKRFLSLPLFNSFQYSFGSDVFNFFIFLRISAR
jgi:hypothetical protein